jgi:hypothetical protein
VRGIYVGRKNDLKKGKQGRTGTQNEKQEKIDTEKNDINGK